MRDRRNTSSSSSSSTCSSFSLYLQVDEKLHSGSSTTLPLPTTEGAKGRQCRLNRMAFRLFVAICGIFLLWHFTFHSFLPFAPSIEPSSHGELEIVAGDILPNHPTALMVHDRAGSLKWTVAIPHNASFPLRSQQYNAICTQGSALQKGILGGSTLQQLSQIPSRGRDRTFMDVMDAESTDVLPPTKDKLASTTCASSLTFVLEASDHGFGAALLLLWLSYGLAEKEGRAFFVDDSRWAYGKYETYFKPIPSPGCTPPPAHHILPCPRQARHLVVSSTTASWIFDSKFFIKYLNRRRFGIERQRPIYDLLRKGYDELFRLADEDGNAAIARTQEIRADAHKHAGSVVGMHIRRGDRHPFEYQFNHDYLPTERYSVASRNLLDLLRKQRGHDDNVLAVSEYRQSPLLFASDDPGLIDSTDLTLNAEPYHVVRAQDRILLATQKALDHAAPTRRVIRQDRSSFTKHVDENTGWDGGFFPALFYAIGQPGRTVSRPDSPITDAAMGVREMIGRAYLLDLAVLGQSSDGVVCAVSSATCRVLGVMLGWDAIKQGRWVNVDDGRSWSLTGKPEATESPFTTR